MRVCHVIHDLAPGGAEQVLVDLARAAPAGGLDLSVVALMRTGDAAVHVPALRAAGVPVESAELGSRWDPRALPRVDALVRRLRPDVVHTHLKHADLVGAGVCRRRGLPQVSTLHVIEDAAVGMGRLKRSAARVARDRVAARTLAVSEAQRRWYVEGLGGDPRRTVVVRNGVPAPAPADAAARAALRAELAVPDGACLAVTAAVLRPGKGVEDLLEALGGLPDSTPLVVAVAGDGPERAALEARAAARPEIAARVRFLGWRDDVPDLLARADLAVHPSHAEALPTALVQAMAAGVPAVATSVGGTPEVVGPGAGRLVPPRRPAELRSALAEVAGDAALRREMGRAAQAWYDAEFRVDRWVDRLVRLYGEVLAEAPARRG